MVEGDEKMASFNLRTAGDRDGNKSRMKTECVPRTLIDANDSEVLSVSERGLKNFAVRHTNRMHL